MNAFLLLLLSPLVTGIVLRETRTPETGTELKVVQEDLDVLEDPVDKMERELDQVLLSEFEPSDELAMQWTQSTSPASAGKQFSKLTFASKIVEACKVNIRNQNAKDGSCADPWFQHKDCSKKFEVPKYRLGDLYFGYAGIASNSAWTKLSFPGSIGATYLDKKTKNKDIVTLKSIVESDNFTFVERPADDELVLHLRGFDVMVPGAAGGYVKNQKYYEKVALKAAARGMKKMTIVTGDHRVAQDQVVNPKSKWNVDIKKATENTMTKIAEIKGVFEKNNFLVTERVNHNADCDFVFMSHANVFVPSGGTFDDVIKMIVRMKNHTVLTDH